MRNMETVKLLFCWNRLQRKSYGDHVPHVPRSPHFAYLPAILPWNMNIAAMFHSFHMVAAFGYRHPKDCTLKFALNSVQRASRAVRGFLHSSHVTPVDVITQ